MTMAIFDRSKELENEELKDVNGGYIFNSQPEGCIPEWEVINDKTGDVMKKFGTDRELAVITAKLYGMSAEEIGWEKLNKLRKSSGRI